MSKIFHNNCLLVGSCLQWSVNMISSIWTSGQFHLFKNTHTHTHTHWHLYIPRSSFCMLSGANCDAVNPCNDTILGSTPYCRSSLQACMLPWAATRCNAVWPRPSNALTYNKYQDVMAFGTKQHFRILEIMHWLIKIWYEC